MKKERANFSGKIGYVLATAGASVGLGNIWRFPYLAAKYGGGIFIMVYFILAITFGYTMIISETALGRKTRKSPVGAFAGFTDRKSMKAFGWINAIIPAIIVPYYSVIGGWVLHYLIQYIGGNYLSVADSGYFTSFITSAGATELYFVLFAAMTILVILFGVNKGVERISKIMMPSLFVLAIGIAVFTITRPGALAGVKYVLVPDFSKFSLMTIVAAMGQMFYSLSIAMGILVTFGSYMKNSTDIEQSTYQVAIVDSLVAILSALMIIPSIFAFSADSASEILMSGPSLLFVSLPKVFAVMTGGPIVGTLFFLMVTFAALTSSIALLESAVSTIEDELGYSRQKASIAMFLLMVVLGTLSAGSYSSFSNFTILNMQFLDFFDFLTNSVMMPIAAIGTCFLITQFVGIKAIENEVVQSSGFYGRKIYVFTLTKLAPVLLVIILISSILNAFGFIQL